jgi:CO/xanthine dehydrogenase FAD-binding subunit
MTRYFTPQTPSEAVNILQQAAGKGRVIGGGTDLLPEIRTGKSAPETLVDISNIPELNQIQIESHQVTIGAGVNFAAIKNHPVLNELVPMLTAAAASIGAGAIQQTATWGGNLVQAMPAADGAIAALALEAKLKILDSNGERWESVEKTFLGPGQSSLDSSRELLTAIRFSYPEDRCWGTAWKRIGRRSALILPIMNCAVKLIPRQEKDEIWIAQAVIALGPAGGVPFRATKAEKSLHNIPINENYFQQAGIITRDESQPRGNPLRASREYRLEIIPSLVCSALKEAAEQIQTPSGSTDQID